MVKSLKSIEISTKNGVISSWKTIYFGGRYMKHVICPICGSNCIKYGKNRSGTQRWFCRKCSASITPKIDSNAKQLQIFLTWLFGKQTQKEMAGEGRTFRRKTSQFWDIWPLPPVVEGKRDVLYVDGIYLGRKACVLICCDEEYVLGWYLCRYEQSKAWIALLSRIAEPTMVVTDGGTDSKRLSEKYGRMQVCRGVCSMFSVKSRDIPQADPKRLQALNCMSFRRI